MFSNVTFVVLMLVRNHELMFAVIISSVVRLVQATNGVILKREGQWGRGAVLSVRFGDGQTLKVQGEESHNMMGNEIKLA